MNRPAGRCNDPVVMKRFAIAALAGLVVLLAAPAAGADEDAAARVVRRAEGLARRAAFHLDSARVERDLRKARCHDGVLSETNAVIRMLRLRIDRMQEAPDPTHRAHHLSVLGVLDRRLDELDGSLRTCNGEHLSATSTGTHVIVIIAPSVPREDPTTLREPRRFPIARR